MHTNQLQKILSDSLTDFKLDQDEKYEFKELSKTIDDEQRRYLRNKAFDLSRPYIEKGGSDGVKVLNWLERVIKAIQVISPVSIKPSAYFSPGDSCRNKIVSLINNARHKIEICVFTISDNIITQAIIEAHRRGILITIITDNDKANDKGSDVSRLSEEGVTVIYDHSPHHMHHKFAIFDEKQLLNGSFNWTRSASTVNEENILVINDPLLLSKFSQKFSELQTQFTK